MITWSGLCLITEDVPRLADFYCRVLQAEDAGDDIHREILLPGGGLPIYSKAAAERDMGFSFARYGGTGLAAFAFTVADVDREYDRLRDMFPDMEFVSPPTTWPWGARSMHFRDPDGNIVCFRAVTGCPPA